jgi:hypothetical protein
MKSKWARVIAASIASAMLTAGASGAATPPDGDSPAVVSDAPARGAIRYDAEYPTIGYADLPTHNAIARLQERLKRGEVRLRFQPPRGYLDLVLDALGIDPSSQTLVYSKTSLQFNLIQRTTPRAIYLDDDTYVAWIPGTALLEIATMDGIVGPVFYERRASIPVSFDTRRPQRRVVDRSARNGYH